MCVVTEVEKGREEKGRFDFEGGRLVKERKVGDLKISFIFERRTDV